MPDLSGFDLAFGDPAHPVHQMHMRAALEEAQLAAEADEVPVGAVILSLERREVVARAHNYRQRLKDPTAHAEMLAITQAAAALQSWRLENCVLYVTLEPCPMCAGAIVQARLPVVVYGAADPKAGACHSLYQITSDARLNHRCQVIAGVLPAECGAILTRFFAGKRALGKK